MLYLWICFYVSPLLLLLITHASDASLCSYTCLPDSVGSCFCVVNATSSTMMWSQAKFACEADGGYLARIDNVQQEILVENLTNTYMVTGTGTYLFSTCVGKSVYIGLRRINCTGSTPMFQWNDNCLNPKLNMTQVSLPSYNMGSFTKSSNPPPFGFGTALPGGVCSDQAHLIVTCTNWGPWEDYPINTPYLVSNYGFACRKDTNPCGSSPCLNGGICTNNLSCFTCACHCGFTGMQCEVVTPCITSTTTSITSTSGSSSIVLLSTTTQPIIPTLTTTKPTLTTTTSSSSTTTNVPTTTTTSTLPTTTTSNWPTTTTSTYSSSSTTNLPMTAAASITTAVSMVAASEATTVLPSISNAVTKTTTAMYGTTGRTATTRSFISLNSGNKSKWLFPVLIALVSIIVTITVVLCCVLLSRYKRSRQSKNSISSQT